jgi:mRNA interferase HigB
MRLIARSVLLAYAEAHPETAVSLERWYRLIKAAVWNSMDDVRRTVPKAKVLNRDRVRFEVAGGNYRLITSFDFADRSSSSSFSEHMPNTTTSTL